MKDATISSIIDQSISSSNCGYSIGGGRVVAGVEHAVGGTRESERPEGKRNNSSTYWSERDPSVREVPEASGVGIVD